MRLMTVNSVEERILAAAKYKLNMDEKVIQAGMFDQKSTGTERQQFLQSILHQDEADEEEENAIPDDELINLMISRSDEETELFKRMDTERLERELNGKPRLITMDELPDWLTKEDDEVDRWNYEEDSILGRGSRQRKEVDYTDSLTEKEWLKVIDGDEDFDDNPDEQDTQDEQQHAKDKKQRKKRRGRREMNSDDSDGDLPLKRKKTVEPKVKKQMQRVMSMVIKYTDDAGRILSDPFMKLPSRNKLPDYYEIIKRPVDIKKIMGRIEDSRYLDFTDLEKDFVQLCQNAQIYNEEASLIYEDSVNLQTVFFEAKQKMILDEEAREQLQREHQHEQLSAHVSEAEADDGEDAASDDEDENSSKMKLKLAKSLSASVHQQTPSSSRKHQQQQSSVRRKRSSHQKKYAISDDDDEDMD